MKRTYFNFKLISLCFSLLLLFSFKVNAQCDASFEWESNNTEAFFSPITDYPDATFFWDFGDGNTSTEFYPIHVYQQGQNNFVFEVTLTMTLPDGTTCTSTEEVTLESIECTSMFNYEVGEDFHTVYFEDTSWGVILDWFWEFGDGTTSTDQHPIHVYDEQGEYEVMLTVNCLGGEVNAFPMQIHVGETFVECNATFFHEWNGSAFYFYPEIFIDDATYFYDFGDGNTSTEQFPSHTYTNSEPGTEYVVTLVVTLANGEACDSVIDIFIEPVECTAMFAHYEISDDGLTIQFEDTSWGIITDLEWVFGDGNSSTEQYPIHTFVDYGDYNVTLSITCQGGETNEFASTINVNNHTECDAGFYYMQELLEVTFIPYTESADVTYVWDFGDGNTSTEMIPIHSYEINPEPQEYWATLTVTHPDGTTCTFEEFVFLEPLECNPMFEYFAAANNELEITFEDTSWGIPTAYLWDFGDGNTSTEQNPTHIYSTSGEYFVTLTITCIAGEVESMTMPAHVGDFVFCDPWFYYDINFNLNEFYFYPNQQDDNIVYTWDFGDGTTSNEMFPVHIYDQGNDPLEFLVTLSILLPDGQTCSQEEWVIIDPIECTSMFEWGPAPDNGLVVTFWDTSWGNIVEWNWDFGDGNTSTEQNPTHDYDEEGVYVVTLLITCSNGETNSFSNDVYATEGLECDAAFGAYFISDTQVYFETFAQNDPSFEFFWDFGDGDISHENSPVHQYAGPGIYWVHVEIFSPNGLFCSYDLEVNIGPDDPEPPFNCEAFFSFNQTDNPMAFDFINESFTATNDISYVWSFGDGATSTQENPTHQYTTPGVYTVTLTIIGDNCESTFPMSIYVQDESFYPENCQSLFMIAPTNLGYFFYDLSEGNVLSRTWNFGDGSTSTNDDPFHQYQVPGEYEVTLDIVTAEGCESSFKMMMNEDGMMGNAIQAYMVTSTNTIADVSLTNVYPNPVVEDLSIEFNLDQQKEMTFEIITVNGVVVQNTTATFGIGKQTQILDLKDLPDGIYLIRISADNQAIRYRVVKF